MAVVVVIALIAGMIMAAYLMIMTYLIIYYINRGKKQNLTMMPSVATIAQPRRVGEGTLRIATA